jgi:hypothetical protein
MEKKPYETPALVGMSLFAAEASSGACCRATTTTCSNTTRDTLRMRYDGAKIRISTNS